MPVENQPNHILETQTLRERVLPNQLMGVYRVENIAVNLASGQVCCMYTARFGSQTFPDTEAWVHPRFFQLSSIHAAITLEVDEDGRYTLHLPENNPDPQIHLLMSSIRRR